MKMNTQRMDKTIQQKQEELKKMEEFREKAIDSANKYLTLLEPILKKRKIQIKSTQMYFNDDDRAMAHIYFTEKFGEYNSIKVKRLQKEIQEAKIPCPIGAPTYDVSITLYEDTLFKNRMQ